MTESEESEHRGPAIEDWPPGFGEASWWPIVTGAGAAGIYAGVALFLLAGTAAALAPPAVGLGLAVGGLLAFLGGLYGWVYHAFVRNYWERAAGHGLALEWGMFVFIMTDVMTFSAGFIYYFFVRSGSWPPAELPPLLTSIVFVNTVLLLVSSLTLHAAHTAIRRGNRRRFLAWLAATVLLGLAFVGGQIFEYYEFLVVEGAPVTTVFFSAFFGLTGLHGLHVVLGVVVLTTVLVRALRGQFDAERHTAVATASMYWHFVDAVWVFLVVTLYVGAVA
ncbi:cytochrome c oxidase subunit 3 [Natronoarchaeum philippinense]|uniref:Cytochrome c oxidase subunit 3 n=1 Tax=Natronoarchaeum philippinense TaxID=558529 RepID=A0A285N1A2_NATPI|nr:heme-copper oxidase subunit III [Natronoarchaeum philippinense]SNZ02567.1 cytochrome c oxidase subunit 3 [Natronoarchaeum philippinense]